MRVLRGLETGPPPSGAIVTIGNYDGLHRGQRAVLDRVIAISRASAAPSMVVSFDPHPLFVLDPERAPKRLTTDPQRLRLLESWGLDALLLLRFDPHLAALSAESFVRDLLVGRLAVREIFVGSRFGFGRGRAGNLDLLQRLGAELGFRASGVPELEIDGAPVSASRIRALLEEGRAEAAADLIGRPYAVLGEVVRGAHRGTELGFPTLNLDSENEILPRNGVYVVDIRLAGEAGARPGVANVGVRPTIGEDERALVEAHLFDFDRSCYGEEVEVRFLRRIRAERRFPSLTALRRQIGVDVEAAREYFRLRAGSPSRAGTTGEAPAEARSQHGNL